MSSPNAKADLLRYLQDAREALLWKLEGLSEYDIRRPYTPTGTNLLGLVKHAAGVELGYFGDVFGRPFFTATPPPAWYYTRDPETNADMWATPEETREEITGLYRQAWRHSDATIEALPLDTVGEVPWWPPEKRSTTLHHLLSRILADTSRHAGHADIVRELLDGATGWLPDKTFLPGEGQEWWQAYHERLERAARQAGGV